MYGLIDVDTVDSVGVTGANTPMITSTTEGSVQGITTDSGECIYVLGYSCAATSSSSTPVFVDPGVVYR